MAPLGERGSAVLLEDIAAVEVEIKLDPSSVRRYRDMYASLIEDLGGEDRASEGQRQLARRAGALVVQAESIEAEIVRGEAVDADDYVRLVNALNRTLCNLGLERRPRDVTPDLTTYIASQVDE